MPKLTWKNLVGQERAKEALGGAFEAGTLGHAYLLCGDEGVGTFQAAIELATAMLCERPDQAPCYECASCRKVAHHAHPDLSIVLPVALAKEHRSGNDLSQKGWDFLAESTRRKVAHPYLPLPADGVKAIPVEWIREVNVAVQRGAVGGGANVAIFCGVELMNKESANAMLKTLEEPPSGSLLLLCTEAPYDVLPTIQSRCQILRFGSLSDGDVRTALGRMSFGAATEDGVRLATECAQGNLGTALELLADPRPEAMATAKRLWSLTSEHDKLVFADGVTAIASEQDVGSAEKILIYCMHLVRNSMVIGVGQGERYVPAGTALVADRGGLVDPARAERLLGLCAQALRAVRARGNLPLVFVNFLFDAMELLNGKERQSG